jgi:hypothetical protein
LFGGVIEGADKNLLNIGDFGNGNHFSVMVDANGQAVPVYSKCGHAQNKFRVFDVHRDNFRVLYEVDGWHVYAAYYC